MIHHVKKATKKAAEIVVLKKVYYPALGVALTGGAMYFAGELTRDEALAFILKGLAKVIGWLCL